MAKACSRITNGLVDNAAWPPVNPWRALHQDVMSALQGRATLSAGCVTAVLAADAGGSEAPLLELAALDVAIDASRGAAGSGSGQDRASMRASARIAANVFSPDRGGWEPAVEPWHAVADLGLSLPGCAHLTAQSACWGAPVCSLTACYKSLDFWLCHAVSWQALMAIPCLPNAWVGKQLEQRTQS